MPGSTSNPNTTIAVLNANVSVGNTLQKFLYVAQQTAAATAGPGELTTNIGNDKTIYEALYGSDGMMAEGIRAGRLENPQTQIDAIGVSDNVSGVASTGTFGFSGTALVDGFLILNVGSERNHRFTIAVTKDDTATTIAANAKAQLDTDTTLPVTSIVATADVNLTAINKGSYGNSLGLSIEREVPGITTTITAMSGGNTDPSLTNVFDVIGTTRYQGIVWGFPEDIGPLQTLLTPRFNPTNAILDGTGFMGITDTLSNHLARVNALNDQNIVQFSDKLTSESNFTGPAQLEIPFVKAAQFAAIRALRLTDGASISQFVITTNGELDAFGGPALASKPYFNMPFRNNAPIKSPRGWTETETRQLELAGAATIQNNDGGTLVISGQVPTTYKTDTSSNADPSFKFLNYTDTISAIRKHFFDNYKKRFAETRLTTGDQTDGRDVTNGLAIRAFSEELYLELSGKKFVLVKAGDDAIAQFKDDLVVLIDEVAGLATVIMKTNIITQLRTILVTIQLSFSTQS